MNNNMNCSSESKMSDKINMPIAMAYVPWQEFQNIDNLRNGYHNGTIFKDLNKPFLGGRISR